MCIDEHNFYVSSQRHAVLNFVGAWLRRWIHFGGWGAALLRCVGSEIDMSYVCMVEKEDYERRLNCLLHILSRQIAEDDHSQSTVYPIVDVVYFNYQFFDS